MFWRHYTVTMGYCTVLNPVTPTARHVQQQTLSQHQHSRTLFFHLTKLSQVDRRYQSCHSRAHRVHIHFLQKERLSSFCYSTGRHVRLSRPLEASACVGFFELKLIIVMLDGRRYASRSGSSHHQ
ncbi:hypothetical protein BDR07DRAFT_1416250 [Suillus spraguei]|nr:hypothetical protein BDR07DRAFT_1416250 [Suillus spraguei]